jgi:diguanylate cyclase (GGDEF)-like protein/PAS domain S-box-containing protein
LVIKDPILVRTQTGLSPQQQIWDALPDALLVIDGEGLVRYANPAVARIFGHDTETLLGCPLGILQPERLRRAHTRGAERHARTGKRAMDWAPVDTVGLHRDGHEFPLEITLFDIDVAGERMVGGILRDGSERQRAQAMQEALRKISEAAHSAPDLQGLFGQIHSIISELLPAKNFYVALHDSVSDLVSFPYWVDEVDPVPDPKPLAERRGLTDVVLRTGEPLLLSREGHASTTHTAEEVALIGTDGIDWLGIPLKTARGTIGVLTVQTYSGSVRYTEKHKQLLQFVSDQVAAAVERKQAQHSLLQSEERFRSVFDQSPIIICLLSYPEGLFQEMNSAGLEAFGFSREEVMGKNSTQLNVWVDLAERQRYLDLLLREGAVRNFEARMRRRDGEVFTVLYSGSLVKLGDRMYSLNSLQDINERKMAEASLQESKEQFKSAFEHSAIGMALVGRDGRFLRVNSALCKIVGYSEDQFLRRTFQDITHPDDLQSDLDQLHKLLAGEIPSYAMEKRYFHRDGSVVLVNLSVSLVRDKFGNPKHFISQIEDITERRRAEQWQHHYAHMLNMITDEAPTSVVLDSLALFAERQSEGLLCSILLLSPDGKRLTHGSAPSLPAFYVQALDGTPIGPDVGSCGAAAYSGNLVVAEDLMTDPNWGPWRELASRAGLRACWSHPVLSAEGRVLGTFAIYRAEPGVPRLQDVELIRRSAGLAAIALERAQHHEDRRLAKVVFEQSLEGIMVTDTDDRIIMVNRSFELLTGYSGGEVIGQSPDILDGSRDDATSRTSRRDALAAVGRWSGEAWGRKSTGEIYPVAMSIAAVYDAAGAPSHYISILADVSDQKIQAARIEQLAFYDSLTGLPNRALFLDRLEQTLVASKRHGGQGAILFLDLDRFKEINDSLGHAVGDMALVEVSRRFQAVSRKEETLARLGGDEFVLIAENADHQTAVRIASRLQRALSEPLDLMGQPYSVGASIGIAFYPADGNTSEDLIKRTDIAMYQAKASGGGYRLYQTEMGVELEKRLNIAKRLGHAMDAGELQLYYQPQIDLASEKVIGAEALLRWQDSVLGWISPADFIPIAEERGMMGPLGDWVLREACRQVNTWAESGLRLDGRLAINVSALQMEDPDIVGRLLEIVHESGLSPDRFELELTESSMMVDPERAVEVMELLSAAGFGLSIDDFGTGYSSLAYLKRFAADQIKIDISFVRNMLTDADDHTIVTTIIAMARSLGLQTTAEGVEEAGQAAALLALGCDFAQGYYFGRPESPKAFQEKWLMPGQPATPDALG